MSDTTAAGEESEGESAPAMPHLRTIDLAITPHHDPSYDRLLSEVIGQYAEGLKQDNPVSEKELLQRMFDRESSGLTHAACEEVNFRLQLLLQEESRQSAAYFRSEREDNAASKDKYNAILDRLYDVAMKGEDVAVYLEGVMEEQDRAGELLTSLDRIFNGRAKVRETIKDMQLSHDPRLQAFIEKQCQDRNISGHPTIAALLAALDKTDEKYKQELGEYKAVYFEQAEERLGGVLAALEENPALAKDRLWIGRLKQQYGADMDRVNLERAQFETQIANAGKAGLPVSPSVDMYREAILMEPVKRDRMAAQFHMTPPRASTQATEVISYEGGKPDDESPLPTPAAKDAPVKSK